MARKPNIFAGVMEQMNAQAPVPDVNSEPPAPPSGPSGPAHELIERPAPDTGTERLPANLARAFNKGPVAALDNDLRRQHQQQIREIDPSMIEASPFEDRLEIDEAGTADLVESIRKHGQRVPILVRPSPKSMDRYIIVYGRRRLAALRVLGMRAKAMVREMDEEESILTQGQENNARLDPSFIEKALFAKTLEDAGYNSDLITDALCVQKSYLSHMRRVIGVIPEATVRAIGAAHGVGWKRWHEAVALIEANGISAILPPDFYASADGTADRFAIWMLHLRGQLAPPAAAARPSASSSSVSEPDGKSRIGRIRRQENGSVHLMTDPAQVGFSLWLSRNAEDVLGRLYKEWQKAEDGHS